ncbi:MAG: tail fiber domain-containing protein [Flavobacteriales bacterium]|nr:tail fiber domain-containing protein [Flavobacteriales bacterium]
MKTFSSILLFVFAALFASAQTPQKFNYQGVARNSLGNVIPDQNIGVKVTIHHSSPSGITVMEETHAVTTNAFGLFNLVIGDGTPTFANMAAISWSGGVYYIEIGLDATGGTTYQSMGTSQLLSVPYALYAETAANPGPVGPAGPIGPTGPAGSANANGTENYISKFTAATALGNSQIFDDGVNVGIGTSAPASKLEIVTDGTITGGLRIKNTGATTGPAIMLHGETKSWTISATNSSASTGPNKLIFRDYSSATDRMVINATGNVGMGTSSPNYKLDVYHSGSTGIRSKSSANYSVVDIDAADGDAALRLYKAGSGMWLIGNNNAGDYFRILELGVAERLMIERTTGNVGIGTSTPIGKLHVAATEGDYAGYFTNNVASTTTHVIHGEANHTGFADVVGVFGRNVVNAYYGFGVRGEGGWYGVRGEASMSGTNTRYGVYGFAGGTSNAAYAVYGNAVGTGTNWGGYFLGDVYTTGSYLPSDADLKSNIKDYRTALATITALPVKTYTYRTDGIYGKMSLPKGEQVGIMAQDLEQIYPQLVKANHFEDVESFEQGLVSKENIESIDFKAVNYVGLVPIMVKAMQEQNQKMEAQQLLIDQLLQRIEVLEAE